jgi:hypothetical protein
MSKPDRAVVDRAGPWRALPRRALRSLWLLARVFAVGMAVMGPVPPPPPPPPVPKIEARAESSEDEDP